MTNIDDVVYRRHQIKVIKRASGYQARAFRGNKPVGETLTADTLDAVVMTVKKLVDAQAEKFAERRAPSGFPCADEIIAALQQVKKNKAQEAMLLAHLNAPENILTATQLAEAAGYKDYSVANRQYGQLGYDLAHELDWSPVETSNGETVWTFTLADDADKEARSQGLKTPDEWRWRLRPEIIEAIS